MEKLQSKLFLKKIQFREPTLKEILFTVNDLIKTVYKELEKMFRLILLIIFIISLIIGAIANYKRKKRMIKALGRDVRDDELTSINSWMSVVEKEETQNKLK